MQGLDSIEAAFFRVKSSTRKAMEGDKAFKEQSFQDIFALNNEIGRLGRERPETMAKMKELQVYVNMITVGLKHGSTKDLSEGIALTEESIRAMKRESTARP